METKQPQDSPVARALGLAGGAAKVAQARGLKTPWGAAKWVKDGLPAQHVLWLAERTEWQITPHELAPQLYPHPDDGLPAERRCQSREAA